MRSIKNLFFYILLVFFFNSKPIYSYPTWIEIGSFIIEDYSWTPMYNSIPYGDENAGDLWNAVNNYCTHSYRSWRINLMNDRISEVSLQNPTGSTNWTREICDFLFIWTHAHEGNIGIFHKYGGEPQDAAKVLLSARNVRFGTAFNRWVFNGGCKSLANYPSFWSEWKDAFEGLQAYYGYSSWGWETFWVGDAMEQWIREWTASPNTHSMEEAYFNAVRDQIYRDGGGFGMEPSVLSARGSDGYFCFRTYEEATSEAGGDCGLKISAVYGTPTY